jgi:hypothetical protein
MSIVSDAVLLPEPELTFGFGQRATHPRDGLFLYGPPGIRQPLEIRAGVIGTEIGIARFRRWATSVQSFIPPKKPALFREAFPGFEAAFQSKWPLEPVSEIIIPDELRTNIRLSDRNEAIFKTVQSYTERLERHKHEEDVRPTFWFAVIPEEVHRWGRPKSRVPAEQQVASGQVFSRRSTATKIIDEGSLFQEEVAAARLHLFERNFHNQLKARLLEEEIVAQIVRETTLTPGDWN